MNIFDTPRKWVVWVPSRLNTSVALMQLVYWVSLDPGMASITWVLSGVKERTKVNIEDAPSCVKTFHAMTLSFRCGIYGCR